MNASRAKSGSLYPKLRGSVTFFVAVAWLLCAGGCATHGLKVDEDGRLRHPELGYEIDAPDLDSSVGWRSVSLDDTDLAYRSDDGRSMSLSSSCKQTRAKPALLARRLLIGIPRDALLSAYPVELRGDPGWAQVVETGHQFWAPVSEVRQEQLKELMQRAILNGQAPVHIGFAIMQGGVHHQPPIGRAIV